MWLFVDSLEEVESLPDGVEIVDAVLKGFSDYGLASVAVLESGCTCPIENIVMFDGVVYILTENITYRVLEWGV